MVLFLARVYDLLAAYSGSCILSLLLTLVLSLSGNARLQGCISSSRKEQAFLIVMTVYLLGNVNITSVYYWPIVQLSSVTQSCPTLCNPMDCSTPGLPVHHQLLEPTQTHVHWVGDAIQPSRPLSSPSPPAFNLSQHQGLFKWVSSLHQVAKVLEFQLQHQSFQFQFRTANSGLISFRMDWLDLLAG